MNDISGQLKELESKYRDGNTGENQLQQGSGTSSFSLFGYMDMVIDGRENLKVDFAFDEGFE